ncbi:MULTISPECIES: N(2)-acetyl-L-2,4-diaminobutanoate deacetylase DoeB [Brucella]|uniref:Ectoine utilization protein EutE n=1 Tax=Brucella lupini TaxID=255457 RepID=A0A256GUM5_9HYPH|nr:MULTISPECIES: N(2)-acetyl-L-2,4-diaminobutanoate deacetylase DoeB [Brucella/Ochrobactrum group]RNL47850.1 N-alpha-acetyl diaminobutyric acid deacetylase DoeB [Ochrobactrum sp. MH181795]KAB2704694.1 N-alpha-acetyl diaminobutyric acid deacetylase DoeB [Brucella lupini]KAB2724475.1 N-alpha-acetyl diaminobutyric acid deacetylase DoeB [Brucella anthropi]KAB2738830.1 N-alpha-acetyl diaminobutyric acid deacetylase DoeB [Brucella anthropi]KAB2797957.1 N-alpha-acetyl diaminobutyric acid deacetylase 
MMLSSPPSRPSPITPTVDLDRDGVQHGHLRLPWSRDDSAWGSLMLPICVIRNGNGPTALLTGGNHGDEYEGPVALYDLAANLKPAEINGRVIIVPAMNFPAFMAGTRTSPIDKGNLNRSFPGRPDGTVTEKIADYFTRYLLPTADIVMDFHSGGRTLDFLPYAAAHVLPDATQEAQCFAAVKAFSAPFSMRMIEIDAVGMYDTTAEEAGKVFVTTELSGGGTISARSAAIAKRGIRNLLRHAGILHGDVEYSPTTWLDMPSQECFGFADTEGLLEPLVDLGTEIRKGDLIARVHNVARTGVAPQEYRAALDGILAARHFPGLIKMGDCLSVIATISEEPSSS